MLRPIGLSDGGSPGDRGGPAGAVVHALPRMVHDNSKGAGLEVKGQGVYRTASRREDMPPWGAAFTLDGQPTEYAGFGGAGSPRPLCLRGERHGLG